MHRGKHAIPLSQAVFRTVVSIVISVAIILALSWLMRSFVFQAYQIPSGSMEQTIMEGDLVFAEKVSFYFREPEPGDIVTFDSTDGSEKVLIKRCIATEGQVIDVKDDKVYVDGVPLDEPYTLGKPTRPLSSETVTYPYTVPEGCIWVMGDNRTNSTDSRAFGAVPVDSVIARGVFIYWPFNRVGSLD